MGTAHKTDCLQANARKLSIADPTLIASELIQRMLVEISRLELLFKYEN